MNGVRMSKVLKRLAVLVDQETEEELAWLCANTKEPPSVVIGRAVHMWIALAKEERGWFPNGKGFAEFLKEEEAMFGPRPPAPCNPTAPPVAPRPRSNKAKVLKLAA